MSIFDIIANSLNRRNFYILAGLFVLAGVLWFFFLAPEIMEIPENFSYAADVVSYDNFYDKESETYQGEQLSSTRFGYSVVSGDSRNLLIRNYFNVQTISGSKIFSVERIYGIDSHTQEHTFGIADRDRAGYLFGPRMRGPQKQVPDKSSFIYWHVNYDTPAYMEFRNEESIHGVSTYVYEANFQADQTENLANLTDVGKTKGVVLNVNLRLWIEPYTGHLVKYEDKAEAYFYNLETGERLYPWNEFHNRFTDSSIAEHAGYAAFEKQKYIFVGIAIPIVLILIGVGIAILNLWGLIGFDIRQKTHLESERRKKIAIVTPFVFLILGTSLTIFIWWFAKVTIQQQIQAEFQADTSKIQTLIEERLGIYQNILFAGAGLFDASDYVSYGEWKTFYKSLRLEKNLPGMQAFAYAETISGSRLNEHVSQMRAQGFSDYAVFPEGQRDFYVPATYIEPLDERNQKALGFDMFQEPKRREAMIYARDSSDAGLTGKVTLIQEFENDIQPGFIIYVPVYKKGAPVNTVEERRESLVGFVYGPFRAYDFMRGLLAAEGKSIHIEIFDSDSRVGLTDENLTYRTEHDPALLLGSDPSLENLKQTSIGGHIWTIKYTALSKYTAGFFRQIVPIILLVSGLILSVLLFLVTYILNNSRRKAVEIAGKITLELEQEKVKDEALLESISDGVVATDEIGKIVFVNRAALNMLRVAESEVMGRQFTSVVQLEDKDGELVPEKDRPANKVFSDKKPMATSSHGNFYVRKDKTKFPVAIAAAPIISNEKIIGTIEVFKDVTQEAEIDRQKNEFLSIASHQLKTPVASLRWSMESLRIPESVLDDRQKKYIGNINNAVKRLIMIVEDLLNASRIDLGTLNPEIKQVEIIALVNTFIGEFKGYADFLKHGIKFINSTGSGAITILADAKMVYGILQNLSSNAVEYSPKDSSVTITLTKEGKMVKIAVTNTGDVIPSEVRARIYEKFFRGEDAKLKKPSGTGIGLYIAKAFTVKMKGEIGFSSEPGKTEFWFTLPIAQG